MALEYFLGLDTDQDLDVLLGRMSAVIGGSVESDRLVGVPGLLVSAKRLEPALLPEAYEDENLRATTLVNFTLHGADGDDERARARWSMFVAAANLPVDLDCDALLTFLYDIACLRRRQGRLELFTHWADWREPWVVERLPAGYELSDEVPRY